MDGTLELLDKNPGRTGRPSSKSQATALQLTILKLQKEPGLTASALAALSEQWLKLEQFKRSIRPRNAKDKRRLSQYQESAGNQDEPEPGHATMREPDEPPAAE